MSFPQLFPTAARTLRRRLQRLALAVCCLATLWLPAAAAPIPSSTLLAQKGEAQLDIVISPAAGDDVKATAQTLAAYLERISGAAFAVTTGDGAAGLVVGLPADFTALPVEHTFGDGAFERDTYRVTSTGDGLYLLGATPQAVEFAVWDLLRRFGHRQFFPTETWEVVPRHDELTITLDVVEKPDYFTRDAPRGGMRMNLRPKGFGEAWRQWRIRNRALSSFRLNTGHSYLALIRRHRDTFDANPGFYAEVNGERKYRGGNTKLCIGTPELRELVVADSIARIKANPDLDSISLDPSDGSSWCECQKCAELGSVSDRVVILCNQVARALDETFDKTYYIGIYAYNDYSPPPTIELHPNVIVSLATAFIRGGQTFEEMLQGWSAKTDMLGIREYYGVPVWNSSMPGAARAASPDYIIKTIRTHYEAGARFINAESDDAWGASGLGYYLASRLLWDVDTSPEATIDDFLDKAFGEAKEPMREFYQLLTNKPLNSDHMMAVMYGTLHEARQQTTDPQISERLNDLVLYTRSVDLQRQWEAAPAGKKQEAFDAIASFIWRARHQATVDLSGASYYLNRQQRQTEAYGWIPGSKEQHPVPPERLRQGGDEPFSEAELAAIITDGLERHERLSFEAVAYSEELVPAAERLKLQEIEAEMPAERRSRGHRVYYTWVDKAPHTFLFQMTNGLITHYRDRGDATIELYPVNEALGQPVATAAIPPDGQTRDLTFETTYQGLHKLQLKDGMDSSNLAWSPGTYMTLKLDFGPHYDYDEQVLCFYVPKGTRTIGGYSINTTGAIVAPNRETVHQFDQTHGYFQAPVPTGQDGKLWLFRGTIYKGEFMLMTVPPYLARNAQELLLPKEVVEADAPDAP